MIVAVHDAFWEEGSLECLEGPSESVTLPIFGKEFEPQVKTWTVVPGQEGNNGGQDTQMDGISASQSRSDSLESRSEGPDDNRLQEATPRAAVAIDGKDKIDGTSYPPIVGVFIVEDPSGLRQKLKLMYEPWIWVDGNCGTQATSTVQVVSPRIECVSPDRGGKPFLRAASIALRIGTTTSTRPNPWLEHDYVPTYQKPRCIDFEEEITRSKEEGRAVGLTTSGGLNAHLSVKEGVSVKRIKLTEIIDVESPNFIIGETDGTREHFWQYPIKSHSPRFINSISLPDHRSEVKITRDSPPIELAIEFEVIFNINRESRPINKLRLKSRTKPPRLNIGFNQIRFVFLVVIHRVEPNLFVYYKCSDGKAPTETLAHKFPRPLLATDERDFRMDKGKGTMVMYGLNPASRNTS